MGSLGKVLICPGRTHYCPGSCRLVLRFRLLATALLMPIAQAHHQHTPRQPGIFIYTNNRRDFFQPLHWRGNTSPSHR